MLSYRDPPLPGTREPPLLIQKNFMTIPQLVLQASIHIGEGKWTQVWKGIMTSKDFLDTPAAPVVVKLFQESWTPYRRFWGDFDNADWFPGAEWPLMKLGHMIVAPFFGLIDFKCPPNWRNDIWTYYGTDRRSHNMRDDRRYTRPKLEHTSMRDGEADGGSPCPVLARSSRPRTTAATASAVTPVSAQEYPRTLTPAPPAPDPDDPADIIDYEHLPPDP
ncbi:hypothetical protein JB92DRAFT_3144022 [Gautieria morchelliformis]|nr:hypothetical protein JB92DRAFT_3144022 [Gautieria morchelliformis]